MPKVQQTTRSAANPAGRSAGQRVNCACEVITALGGFVENQNLWNAELTKLKTNNGTSQDLRNWVNNTSFINPTTGQPITFPVP
jgi:hypothetical protein